MHVKEGADSFQEGHQDCGCRIRLQKHWTLEYHEYSRIPFSPVIYWCRDGHLQECQLLLMQNSSLDISKFQRWGSWTPVLSVGWENLSMRHITGVHVCNPSRPGDNILFSFTTIASNMTYRKTELTSLKDQICTATVWYPSQLLFQNLTGFLCNYLDSTTDVSYPFRWEDPASCHWVSLGYLRDISASLILVSCPYWSWVLCRGRLLGILMAGSIEDVREFPWQKVLTLTLLQSQ